MSPVIRIDDQVWSWLKSQAEPFEDTPNSVLRRLAGMAVKKTDNKMTVDQNDESVQTVTEGRTLVREWVQHFRTMVAEIDGTEGPWRSGRRLSEHLRKANFGESSVIAYVKGSSEHGFWGLNINYLKALDECGFKWFVVLLDGSPERSLVLAGAAVNGAVQNGLWGRSGSDYKVHVGPELNAARRFTTHRDAIALLLQGMV